VLTCELNVVSVKKFGHDKMGRGNQAHTSFQQSVFALITDDVSRSEV